MPPKSNSQEESKQHNLRKSHERRPAMKLAEHLESVLAGSQKEKEKKKKKSSSSKSKRKSEKAKSTKRSKKKSNKGGKDTGYAAASSSLLVALRLRPLRGCWC